MEAGAARSALETAAAAGSSAADPGTEWKVSEVLHPHQRVKTLDGWTLSPSDHAAASKKQLLQNYEELQHAHEILKIDPHLPHLLAEVSEGILQIVIEAGPVEIEELIKGGDLISTLHHGSAKGILKDVPILNRELFEGQKRIDPFGDGHAKAAFPKQIREFDDLALHLDSLCERISP